MYIRMLVEGGKDRPRVASPGGTASIPFKDRVSRTAVYRDYGLPEGVEGLEAFDS